MYLPYLRCKSEEINCLTEVSPKVFTNTLPILEPVGIKPTNINKFKKLKQNKIPFILIVNPQFNDLKMEKILEVYVHGLLSDYSNYSIALVINNSITKNELELFYSIKNIDKSLIHKMEFNNIKILDSDKIKYQIFQDNKVSNAYINSFSGSNRIILTDGFQKLARNADYPERSLFSDKHLNFSNLYIGVGDYLIQGDNFSESGGPAAAVAIHLTNNNRNGIYINHFVSDNREGASRTPEKFMEALTHLVNFIRENDIIKTEALEEYQDLYDKKHYPGLGKNKRIALKHHIETISKLI